MGKSKITFLIGSGASIPAGMPKTCEITDAICGIRQQQSDDEALLWPDIKYNSAISCFIKKELVDIYKSRYGKEIEINYEDIYHGFDQVCNDDVDQYPNPLLAESFKDNYLRCFINIIEQQFPKECIIGRNIEISGEGIALLATHDNHVGWIPEVYENTIFPNLRRYIEDNLVKMLNLPIEFSNLHTFWNDIARDYNYEHCDIFSLNHDLVLESLFTKKNIPYNDGLNSTNKDGLRYWDRNLFKVSKCKMQLYKLHGSINWWYHKKGVVNCNSSEGKRALLIGTYMKMLEYAGPDIFQDLFHLFYRRLILEEADNLIVIGYGFRDRGVNNMIINWIYNNTKNKMVIIDPDVDGLKNSKASPAIRRLWEKREVESRILEIKKYIEEVSWECVTSILKEL